MIKVKLGEVATYINGYAFKPQDWTTEGKEIIRIQNLTKSSKEVNYYAGDIDDKYLIEKGDILISWSGTLGLFEWMGETAVLNQHIFKVVFDKLKVDKEYFKYVVEKGLQDAVKHSHGSTMKHLTKKNFDNILINYPTLKEQQIVSQKLGLLDKIIQKRQIQLDRFNELVKSRFYEMFGDIFNTKFSMFKLEELCEFIKDGTHQTPKYTDDKINGFKFLSSKDVTSGKISWESIKYIPEDLHNELYSKIAPKRNDILLAKNGTTGVAALVDCDDIFDIYVSLAILRFHEGNNPKYLLYAINSDGTKWQFNSSLKGVGVPNLHLGEIRKTKIPLPPLALQNQFADFVAEVDKSQLAIKKSLDELETLKKSLMQAYFG